MFQSATSPLWFELLKATFGPVTAAVVFIIGLLWRDRIERRNAAQAWFEQTYITEGLDVVSGHLAVLCHSTNERRRTIYSDTLVLPLPSTVSSRLLPLMMGNFLSGVDTADAIILAAMRPDHPIKITEEESKELLQFCISLGILADSMRSYLLSTKIVAKNDIYKICNNTQFVQLLKDVENEFFGGDLNAINTMMAMKFGERIANTAKALKSGS